MGKRGTKFANDIYIPVNTEKYVGSHKPQYRSSWELQFMRFLDHHPSVIQWASEPFRIPYYNQYKRSQSVYIPDFLVVYQSKSGNKTAELLEVKPKKQVTPAYAKTKAEKFAVALNMMKWEAAAAYCKNKNMKFRVITEEDLFNNPTGKKK